MDGPKHIYSDDFPVSAEIQRTLNGVGRMLQAGRESLLDPAAESALTEMIGRMVKPVMSNRLQGLEILERLIGGGRSLSELRGFIELDHRRIAEILKKLVAKRMIDAKIVNPAGGKGGRPRTLYYITEMGKSYVIDARIRREAILLIDESQ